MKNFIYFIKLNIYILSLFFLISCTNLKLNTIETGPKFKETKIKDIELFTNQDQVKRPFGAIAIIHGERFICGKLEKKYLKKTIKEASSMGADAIIYTFYKHQQEDLTKTKPAECNISALAIKYVDKLKK